MPHLVIEKRSADEIKDVHVAATACSIVVVVIERGYVRAQDTPSEGRELFRRIELAQIAKVVLADESRSGVPHRVHVEVTRREEVLVVSRATRETCGKGRRYGRPGVDPD